MPRPYASAVIPAAADDVWALIRDFNGLPGWHPGISESSLDSGTPAEVGSVRRLVLGDGLWYAQKLGATHLVDVATLTGAVVVALGKITSGIFGTAIRPTSTVLISWQTSITVRRGKRSARDCARAGSSSWVKALSCCTKPMACT